VESVAPKVLREWRRQIQVIRPGYLFQSSRETEKKVIGPVRPSPDDQTLLYTQYDTAGCDLMLVEDFR